MKLPLTKARLGIAAGALGAAGALTLAAAAAGSPSDPAVTSFRNTSSADDPPGDVSGPCDEAEHADDPRCDGVGGVDGVTVTEPTAPTTSAPTTPATPTTGIGTRSLPTVGGTVTYRSDGASLTLVSAMPANGWRVEVEQASGREIEVDFRAGGRRVQINVEIEDGQVRERVRLRNDADGTDVRIENGMVVDDHGDDMVDDHGDDGPGHDVGDDRGDDGAVHDVGDDHGGASSGSDDSGSGSSGSGSSGSGSSHSGGSDDSGSSGSDG
jgi:hypothetical protein